MENQPKMTWTLGVCRGDVVFSIWTLQSPMQSRHVSSFFVYICVYIYICIYIYIYVYMAVSKTGVSGFHVRTHV